MFRIALILGIFFQSVVYGQSEEMVRIEGGTYLPLYGTSTAVIVDDFLMDVYPVTNQEFLEFVEDNPRWKRSQVKRLFANNNYLMGWKNDLELGDGQLLNSPVTSVSWFAAKDYCECQGKRLPTVDEWEYAGMAGWNVRDGRNKEAFNQFILNWYETPETYNNKIGENFKNYWGVYDMHGLVWEWTLDFNTVMITGESRDGNKGDNKLFCGAASIGANDLKNYAAFIRYAFRGSLKGNYAIKNLGFRCVKDINPETN